MGPLVSASQRERAGAYIALGVAEGARLVCGGDRLPRAGYFMMLVLKIAELQKRVSYNKLSLETMLNIDSGEGRVDLIYTVEVE